MDNNYPCNSLETESAIATIAGGLSALTNYHKYQDSNNQDSNLMIHIIMA